MRKLILVTNTPLPLVEVAISEFISKLKEKTDRDADYEILFGRADYPPRVHHRAILVMLGVESYKSNASIINANAIGILLDNPMTLGCIKGDNVEAFDYRVKRDGVGIYLDNWNEDEETYDEWERRTVEALMLKIKTAFFSKDMTGVRPEILDRLPTTLIPNVLNSIKETTSFAKEFASLNYSVRNELDRDRIRRSLFKWIVGKSDTDDLLTTLKAIVGKNSAAIRNLVSTFDADDVKYKATAINIRQALSAVLGLAMTGKNNIPFEKVADRYYVSPYDLKYAVYLFKKDPLLIADMKSSDIHYNNSKFRSTGSTEEVPQEQTVSE